LTVLATLIGARLGHAFFMIGNFYLSEIILPFRFTPNFEFTDINWRHGAAISIIVAMYFYSKTFLRPQWILDR
jgi:hypothetical protein